MNDLVRWLRQQATTDYEAVQALLAEWRDGWQDRVFLEAHRATQQRIMKADRPDVEVVEAYNRFHALNALLDRYERAAGRSQSRHVPYNNAVDRGFLEGLTEALKCAAIEYQNREGYREEWRP